jgi:predicted permease
VIAVALTVIAAALAGVLFDHRTVWGLRVAGVCLTGMLNVLLPLVVYVSFAHLHLSTGNGAGLLVAWVGLGLAGLTVWCLVRDRGLPRPAVGAAVAAVIIANTGYLGYPMAVALFGSHALPRAVAYDQLVSSPLLFSAGFAVAAAFGDGDGDGFSLKWVGKRLVLRNPPLIAAVAGLVVPAGWAPPTLVTISHVVVEALLVIGFFVVGVYLSAERRGDGVPLLERPDRTVLAALVARFTVNPALLGLVALAGLGIPRVYILQAFMPSGIGSLIVGHAYGLDQRLIATVIVWDTLLVLAVGMVFYLA